MTNKQFLQSLMDELVNDRKPCNEMIERLAEIIDNYDKIERLQSILNGDYS